MYVITTCVDVDHSGLLDRLLRHTDVTKSQLSMDSVSTRPRWLWIWWSCPVVSHMSYCII